MKVAMEFDAFYRENYGRIQRAMTLGSGDPELAEEITQEAFYRTLRRWKRVSQLERPDAWTMVVALNLGRDNARRQRRHAAKAPLLAGSDLGNVGEQGIEDRMFVMELLGSVTDRQREVLVLRYVGQLSVPEIARSLKCPEGTVKSTLHTALEKAAQSAKGTEHVDDR
jgi:RNA polymerase sigma-70 factor, ECF subfamily